MRKKIFIPAIIFATVLTFAQAATAQITFRWPNKIKADFQTQEKTGLASGSVNFVYFREPLDYRAEFSLKNIAKAPLDFNEARYSCLAESGEVYPFQFERVDFNEGGGTSEILPPGKAITIFCKSPINPEEVKIKKIFLEFKDGKKVEFLPAPREQTQR
jgi:hypothetical protein